MVMEERRASGRGQSQQGERKFAESVERKGITRNSATSDLRGTSIETSPREESLRW